MSPAEVKAALAMALGPNAESYWRTFSDFLQAKISRAEFEDLISERLNTPHLKQLHNSLLMEIIGAACTSEPDSLTTNLIMPANKRRRVHPYQGNEDDRDTFHSARLKHWVVSLPSRERQELATQATYAEKSPRAQRLLLEEVWQERGYEVDVGRRPTTTTPLALCTLTRALPSLPDLHERTRAIAMEHGLTLNPNTTRTFAKLFSQALEEFLTKIVTATLTTITRSESQYESIQAPANLAAPGIFFQAKNANSKVTISVMSLATTYYITPSIISFPSPAMLRVLMQDFQWPHENEDDDANPKRRGTHFLGARAIADYYRLARVSRSGGRSILSEYPIKLYSCCNTILALTSIRPFMDDPWGNAWSEVDKEPVQEVDLKPKDDKWITSPVSGDIGVAWTSEWQVPSDKKTTLEPSQGIFPSTSAPWDSELGTMGDRLSPVDVEEPVAPVGVEEPLQVDVIDDAVGQEAFPNEDRPTSGVFDGEEVITDSWKSLSHAAIVVGDEAAWDSAWKPPADEMDEKVESPRAPVVDEWTRAIEEKAIRDTRIPQEVMEIILHQFDDLSMKMWPGEDLASARAGPAPRDEWQGGLENVEGLTPLVNRYMPPQPTAPPIRFAGTRTATSFQNAMKLTRSYGIVQQSPLSKLIKASDVWEQSAKKEKQFSLESWLLKGSDMPLSPTSMSFDALDTQKNKPAGIMGIFSRPSLDRGRASSSSSPVPRTSQDLTAQMTPTSSSVSAPPNFTSVGSSNGVSSPMAAPASTSTPSAVTRFLNRWSRRADDSPRPTTPVNLKSEELDFLDMIPEMKQGSVTAEATRKELGGASGYPGAQSMTFGGMMPAASLKKTVPSTANLSQLSSADFESLLEQQILEIDDAKMKESLIAVALVSEPTPNAYSNLSASFFGKQPIAGALPLNQKSTSQMSNTLFDDDDFDAFLGPPAQPAQASALPTAPTSYPEAPLPPIPRTIPYNTPAVPRRASLKVSPIPPRTVAIMNQSGSRPSTPSILAAAPLLPPPPGRTGSVNLLNGNPLIAHPPSQRNETTTFGSTGTGSGIADLGSLLDFTSTASPAPPKPPLVAKPVISSTASANTGGLSAQDLSFFEGL